MPVDNQLYNRPGDIWWDENEQLSMLATMLNPVRFSYFRTVLTEHLRMDPAGRTALDVGCGGGLLAEEFARLGMAMAGVDPSHPSLMAARNHAAQSNLSIRYIASTGEQLPFGDATYDIALCCDVLEHVDRPAQVIGEMSRVLRPGGILLYDTVNRTLLSNLAVIKVFQDWSFTSCAAPNLHDWTKFIKPAELGKILAHHGLQERFTAGMKPAANPIDILRQMRKRKRGEISYGELGRRMKMALSRDLSISYLGCAVKTG